MNILHFADYSAPYEGNFIASLRALTKSLEEQDGQSVFLFAKGAKDQVWAKAFLKEGRDIYFLGDGMLRNMMLMARIIKKHHIKIIHTHFSVLKYDLILKIARIFSRKTITIRHMHMLYQNKKSIIFEKIKRFISHADIEITCGNAAYQSMILAGFSPRNLYNVTNAIDFTRLDHYDMIRKAEMGLSESTKLILMFGYQYITKGVDIAIQAVKQLHDKGYDIALLIVVAKGDKDIANKITEEFGSVPSYVKILPPRSDIASYYKLADIFLSASRFESFCYALREAAYLECLTIASDIEAHQMTKFDRTFKSENVSDLADAIKEATENCDHSQILRYQREFVIKEYDMMKWSCEMIKIYQHI